MSDEELARQTFILQDSPYVRILETDNARFREALRVIHDAARVALGYKDNEEGG